MQTSDAPNLGRPELFRNARFPLGEKGQGN